MVPGFVEDDLGLLKTVGVVFRHDAIVAHKLGHGRVYDADPRAHWIHGDDRNQSLDNFGVEPGAAHLDDFFKRIAHRMFMAVAVPSRYEHVIVVGHRDDLGEAMDDVLP